MDGPHTPEKKAGVHRRKSSKDEDESDTIVTNGVAHATVNGANGLSRMEDSPSANGSPLPSASAGRLRVNSSPTKQPKGPPARLFPAAPPSAGPFTSSFNIPRSPNGLNGSPSPLRTSFVAPSHSHLHSHSRTRSVSGPTTSHPSASPRTSTFPVSTSPYPHSGSSDGSSRFSSASAAPQVTVTAEGVQNGSSPHSRRHTRIHSRNLSVFFPRPGSLPHSAISEDGVQEFSTETQQPAALDIPVAEPSVSAQLQGWTFGGSVPSSITPGTGPSGKTSRRGHHHKHSMSHNFFSFLEPGSDAALVEDLHTQPAPVPISSWTPSSSETPISAQSSFSTEGLDVHDKHASRPIEKVKTVAVAVAVGQFILGVCVWVVGQQIGSLSCTGLGYWVVFDAFGVALSRVLPGFLATSRMQAPMQRSYGHSRIETVAMFAQAVYLMFSSVYVCKETVEHFLLSAGEGHHHHHGDEDPEQLAIDFPILLTIITFISLSCTAFFLNNHSKLVSITDYRIPSPASLLHWLPYRFRSSLSYTHSSSYRTFPLSQLLSNPFVSSPLFFCTSIISVAILAPPTNSRLFDLALALIETVITFKVAYRACVVLGTVLLQTSPDRGLKGGRMEAFLRAMREIERNPTVVHLPPPHIWQLTPSLADVSSSSEGPEQSLIITLELHVRGDLGDDDVLELSKWAWERCVNALHFSSGRRGGGEGDGVRAEVTVGVVRER